MVLYTQTDKGKKIASGEKHLKAKYTQTNIKRKCFCFNIKGLYHFNINFSNVSTYIHTYTHDTHENKMMLKCT